MTPEEIARRIDDMTTDWNGARMVDGEPPRIVPTCGELRAIASAIRAEREKAEKAEAERDRLREALERIKGNQVRAHHDFRIDAFHIASEALGESAE